MDGSATLGKVIQDATTITVLRVEKVNVEKRVIIYKKVADLKGAHAADEMRHAIGDGTHPREPKTVLELARPGFHNGKAGLVCLGRQGALVGDDLWPDRAEPRLFRRRRPALLPPILQGQTVTITAVAHSVNDYWAHGDVANKKVLGGSSTPIWRIRASLQMQPLGWQFKASARPAAPGSLARRAGGRSR